MDKDMDVTVESRRIDSSPATDTLSRRTTLRWIGGGGFAASLALLGPGRGRAAAASVAENETIARQLIEALNAGNLDDFAGYLAEDIVIHVTPQPLIPPDVQGREAVRGFLSGFVLALPDGTTTLDDLIAGEQSFAMRVTFTGTHTQDAANVTATGKAVTISTLYLAHVENGQIVEGWLYYVAPPWAMDLTAQGAPVAAQATPAAAGALDALLDVPGVVAALEFAPDGTLVEYRSEIDIPRTEVEQTAEFIATAGTFLPALLARYNEISTLEWDLPRWVVYSSDAWTAVFSGNRAILAETAGVDFNQLYGALAGAR